MVSEKGRYFYRPFLLWDYLFFPWLFSYFLLKLAVFIRHKIASIFIFTIILLSVGHSENTVRGLLRSSDISPTDIYNNQWALIIGINKYHDFPQLSYAVEDAKSMKTKTSYFKRIERTVFKKCRVFLIFWIWGPGWKFGQRNLRSEINYKIRSASFTIVGTVQKHWNTIT